MCGRTCLTLQPGEVKCACKYSNQSSVKIPEWRDEYNFGRKYEPSFNIAPTDITPVLISSDHFSDATESQSLDRLLVPMMWGMIPYWHKGDYKKHGLTTNNCRLEHMLDSKLYVGSFRRGQRCVILCEGFYEWQTTKPAKSSERAAYFLYMPQVSGIRIHDKSTWNNTEAEDGNGVNRVVPEINLLKLAGLFDIWENETGDKIYSYSVITFESCEWMSWLHHRMPAILESDQQVSDWLDFKRVSDEEALRVLKPSEKLNWHRVSNVVNNSRNKSHNCNKPINENSGIMQSWLIRKRKIEEVKKEVPSDSSDEELQSFDVKHSRK